MAKRLQVILQDSDDREIQRLARSRHMSIAAWVRPALDWARRREPLGSMAKKVNALRAPTRRACPLGDIQSMLAEIKAGYRAGHHS